MYYFHNWMNKLSSEVRKVAGSAKYKIYLYSMKLCCPLRSVCYSVIKMNRVAERVCLFRLLKHEFRKIIFIDILMFILCFELHSGYLTHSIFNIRFCLYLTMWRMLCHPFHVSLSLVVIKYHSKMKMLARCGVTFFYSLSSTLFLSYYY